MALIEKKNLKALLPYIPQGPCPNLSPSVAAIVKWGVTKIYINREILYDLSFFSEWKAT